MQIQFDNEFGNNFDLSPIFKPKSMVVVGVSQQNYMNPGTTIFLKNFFEMDLGSNTFGVNPKGGFIESQKLYENIKSIPINPDISVIAIIPKLAVNAVKELIEKNTKGIIIISGGFAEAGKEGKKLQDEIKKLCIDANVPLIGPNCIGIYNPPYIDTIFLPTEKLILPRKGNVAIISQSGGIMLDQFFLSCYERNIGVSAGVSIGNKAVINEIHLLDYFAKDVDTNVIAFYIEGFEQLQGRKFLESSKKISKDIIIYQGGKTDIAKSAVQSHTASLASNFQIAKSAFKQFGIILPETEEEVGNYIKTYSVITKRKPAFNFKNYLEGNVVVLTVSGGHGVVCVDLLENYKLKIVKFETNEIEKLKNLVNETIQNIGSFNNPIDLTGSATDEDIIKILDFLFQLDKIDIIIAIVVPYPPAISIQIGRKISFIARHYNKPLICFVPYIEKYNLIREALELYNIPVAHTVSEAVQMAAAIRDKSRAILRLSYRQ